MLSLLFSCSEQTKNDQANQVKVYSSYPSQNKAQEIVDLAFENEKPGQTIVFSKVSMEEADTVLSERKEGTMNNNLYQHYARSYTRLDDSEPFIYDVATRVQLLSDGNKLKKKTIYKKPNSSPVDYSQPNLLPKLHPEIESILDASYNQATIDSTSVEVLIKISNVPRFNRPLKPRIGAQSSERLQVQQAREQWEEDRLTTVNNLVQPIFSDIESYDGTILSDINSNGWFSAQLPLTALEFVADDTRLKVIRTPLPPPINNSCIQDCYANFYQDPFITIPPLEEWYLGDAGRQTRLGSNHFIDAGYNGSLNNPWNNYGAVVAGISGLGKYEDDNLFDKNPPYNSTSRIFKKYHCSSSGCTEVSDIGDDDTHSCSDPGYVDDVGCHETPVASIILGNYRQEVVEDGDNQLGDQCYSDTPDYSHCNEFYEKTHGIAIHSKGIYYHSENSNEACAKTYKRARLDKVDVLNMSHGTSNPPRCDPMYSDPYIDELEDAFDDGVFPVNSSGNYSDEDYSIPKYRGTGGVNHCLINDRSLVPKVFSVGAIYNEISYYAGWGRDVTDKYGNTYFLKFWDFFDFYENSDYEINRDNRSAYFPINSEDYGRMRLYVFGSQTGGATLVIDNSTYSRPLTGIDLLAPGSGWMSTGANGPIGIANERFCCSSGAAPHVSGLALLVKNWLLSEGVSVINNPGVLHTVMLAMGDRSVFNESSYEHDYNITGGDIMYGFGRAKLRLLGHSQGIPNSGYAADSFTFTQGNFPADGGRRLLFAGPTPEDTHFIKCVALQIEDMDNKSSTDMVSALNFKLSLADPYTNQYGTKYCSSTRPGNYYIEKDDSYDTKKMVSVSSSTGQYVEDKCLYIEFEDKHITNQGVNVKTFCYYSPVPDYASSSGHSCVKSKTYHFLFGYLTSAFCWGNNDYGQLGTGDRKYKFSPEYVSNSSSVKEIAAGGGHTCMIRTLSGDDHVYCWGKNHKGQLGNENTDHQTSQTLVPYFSYWNFSSYHDLALGKEHTCMLADLWGASLLFCWGSNEYGQLGISGVEYSSEPLLVDYFDDVGEVDSISAGSYHTCVTQDKKAYCWGLNDSGQLGINNTTTTSTPTQIVNISNIVSISAGGEHTCAINDYNGINKLYCWGNNKHGQIVHGQSDNDYTYDASPVEITNIPTPVNKVSAGGYHTCAIGNGSSNSLYCWGNNSYGQLGDNNAPYGRTVSNRYYQFSNALDISAGNKNHTCAVYNNNGTKQLYCWGANDNGQLGRNKVNLREDTIGSPILSGAAAYYVSAGE